MREGSRSAMETERARSASALILAISSAGLTVLTMSRARLAHAPYPVVFLVLAGAR